MDGQSVHKIVIVGGGGVGKSCITLRFLHDSFEETYDPTIEDSYLMSNFMVDGVAHNIEVLDTAGQVINKYCLQGSNLRTTCFKDKMILNDLLI